MATIAPLVLLLCCSESSSCGLAAAGVSTVVFAEDATTALAAVLAAWAARPASDQGSTCWEVAECAPSGAVPVSAVALAESSDHPLGAPGEPQPLCGPAHRYPAPAPCGRCPRELFRGFLLRRRKCQLLPLRGPRALHPPHLFQAPAGRPRLLHYLPLRGCLARVQEPQPVAPPARGRAAYGHRKRSARPPRHARRRLARGTRGRY